MRVSGPTGAPPDPGVVPALDYLKSFRIGAEECLEHLDHLRGVLHRLALFRTLFPEEFEKVRSEALRLEPGDGPHTVGELRFVELLKNWFPVDEAMEEMEGGFDSVPVFTRVHDDPETLEDVEYLRLGLKVGVVLLNFVEVGTELLELLPFAPDAIERLRIASPYAVDFDRLAALCDAEASPLRFLHVSVRIARRDTDNPWFDAFCMCGQCGSSIEWSEENLRWLAEIWSAADEFYEQIAEFEEWIQEDPPSRLEAVVELWNRSERTPGGENESTDASDGGPR